MEFKPFIYNAKQEQIPVSIAPMTDADAQKTISAWQTAWTSDYLSDLRLEKYAAKLDEELIACLLYTSPSPRDMRRSRMPSSA